MYDCEEHHRERVRRFEGKVALITGRGFGHRPGRRVAPAGRGRPGVRADLTRTGSRRRPRRRGRGRHDGDRRGLTSRRQGGAGPWYSRQMRRDVRSARRPWANSGTARSPITSRTSPVEQYRQMMGVNVDGYFLTRPRPRSPSPRDRRQHRQRPRRTPVSWARPYTVVYCMTKGRVVQLTRASRWSRSKTNMRVKTRSRRADPDDSVGELPHSGRRRRQPDASLHGFSTHGVARRHRAMFASRVRRGVSVHGAILAVDEVYRGLSAR